MYTNALSASDHLMGEGVARTEIGTIAIFLMLAAWAATDTHRRKELGILTLCGIGGFSISWQEFYADWGLYLLWSEKFHLLPWGSTPWTTPLKPAYVLPSYAVYMFVAFALMLAISKTATRTLPRWHPLLVCLLTAGPVIALVNFGLELYSVANAGQWNYFNVIGPAIVTAKGQQPILFPNIPLGIFGAVTCYLMLRRDNRGHPTFETITRPAHTLPGWQRESRRALAWIAVWNCTYLLFLTGPVVATRLLWGRPDSFVP